MPPNNLRNSRSLSKLMTTSTSLQTSNLSWSDWADAPFLNYLDLTDCRLKKNTLISVPWFQIPFSENDIVQYCMRTVYNTYKTTMMIKIAACEENTLPSLIRKLLRVTKLFNVVWDPNESSCLYYTIAYILFDKSFKDPSLFLTMWNTLCLTDRAKVAVLSGVIGKHRRRKPAKLLRYILETAHSVRFSLWGAWTRGHNVVDFNYCPITAALLSGNVEQINILIQYGFVPNSRRLCTYDKHFMFCVNSIYDWLRRPLIENGSERRKTITEVLLFLINTASSRSKSRRVAMTHCFRLLWNALPTPYVTKDELRHEVQLRFLYPPDRNRITNYPSTENQFMQLCDYYPDVFFGDISTQLQPRSLRHLCKCAIRSHLHSAWNLPTGIKCLPLPTHLKTYLQLETFF